MIFEYKIPSRRDQVVTMLQPAPASEPLDPAPRVARLVALAHKLEGLVGSGRVKDYAELARMARVSPARIAQIVILGQLAPDIQEYILFLSAEPSGLITEPGLRAIAREPRWDLQRAAFERLLDSRR
jgi:hypothetical protein